jgi:hypothetical protein
MKNMKSLIEMLALAVAVLFVLPAQAQDDLYYDPATDATYRPPADPDNYPREESKITKRYDDEYYEEDDYAYEYSSRIRRFHRPAQVVDYYDPYFVDMWMYDPYYSPGATIYAGGYNDYWRWRRWQRWQRWNSWSMYDPYWGTGFNNWGWSFSIGRPWGWNTWHNPYVWNNYFYDPYWVWNGYNPYYCPNNVWVNNNYYWNNTGGYNNNNGGYSPKTYTGVRRGGTTVNPGYARMVNSTDNTTKGDRLAPSKTAPVIELDRRPDRFQSTSGDRKPADGTRVRATTPETTRPTRDVLTPEREGRATRDVTPSREGRQTRDVTPVEPNSRPKRDVTPERDTRPAREVMPERESPRERDVTPTRETRPTRKDETSSREVTPSRRESTREREVDERPSRRSEPSYERQSRSSDNDRGGFQPGRSERSSSGGGTIRSGGDGGSRNTAPSSRSSESGGRSRRGN